MSDVKPYTREQLDAVAAEFEKTDLVLHGGERRRARRDIAVGAFASLVATAKQATDERDAMQRRAEAAEADWRAGVEDTARLDWMERVKANINYTFDTPEDGSADEWNKDKWVIVAVAIEDWRTEKPIGSPVDGDSIRAAIDAARCEAP